MNKKAEFGWEQISKILLVLIVLIILVGIVIYLKGKGSGIITSISNIFRFS
jgi:Ni,Fe-hydrogenase I cytochrome b subunit